jgi:hypothetical protein
MGLASQLHTSAQKRASTVVPWVRRALGIGDGWEFDVPIQGSPRVTRADGGPPRRGYDHLPPCTGRDRFPSHENQGSREPQGARPFQSRPYIQGGRDDGWTPPQRGRFARPDWNKGGWGPKIICDACCRTGHVAANCDMLAMAIFLDKYKRISWTT